MKSAFASSHFLHVVGARPNFMKVAPVISALRRLECTQTLVHTGQHYDQRMSEVFFEQLDIPAPDVNLEVGSGSHAQQTAAIITRFEPVVIEKKPDLTFVYGDVNSTVAAAIVCSKLGIPLAHVEAGLRSRDRSMPEEINRLITDQISDLLLTPSADADANLLREGIAPERIHCIGNVMIDTLVRLLPQTDARWAELWMHAPELQGKGPGEFALLTLHRPSNVDSHEALSAWIPALTRIAEQLPVIFPVHPRTRARLPERGMPSALVLTDPLSYIDFVALQSRAKFVITDSGGIQEETTWLGVPCLTLRNNTERPITITHGTNVLVGSDPRRLLVEADRILSGRRPPTAKPPLWDGKAALRIANVIARWSQQTQGQAAISRPS